MTFDQRKWNKISELGMAWRKVKQEEVAHLKQAGFCSKDGLMATTFNINLCV